MEAPALAPLGPLALEWQAETWREYGQDNPRL